VVEGLADDAHAPLPLSASLQRVVVVGCSGSGKTTLARRLAVAIGGPHVELDALHWDSHWMPRAAGDFLRDADAATRGERWVVDGNYRPTREIVWPRATAVVWLNLGFPTVFARVFRRTVRRVATREPLYADNRETLWRSFASRESILWWVMTSYRRGRRQYRALQSAGTYPHLTWFEMRRARDVARFLAQVAQPAQGRPRTPD
jgi:adenylate kinase family enzyme